MNWTRFHYWIVSCALISRGINTLALLLYRASLLVPLFSLQGSMSDAKTVMPPEEAIHTNARPKRIYGRNA